MNFDRLIQKIAHLFLAIVIGLIFASGAFFFFATLLGVKFKIISILAGVIIFGWWLTSFVRIELKCQKLKKRK